VLFLPALGSHVQAVPHDAHGGVAGLLQLGHVAPVGAQLCKHSDATGLQVAVGLEALHGVQDQRDGAFFAQGAVGVVVHPRQAAYRLHAMCEHDGLRAELHHGVQHVLAHGGGQLLHL
jgi:hypothetical protein